MKIEVRAVGLKANREKRGLTQRKPAHDLVISQNYIPAIGLLVLGFVIREFVFRAGGSVWEDLRHLFDIGVPQELEAFGDQT